MGVKSISSSSIGEGESFITTFESTPGTTIYWKFSGPGITSSDFSSGSLNGFGTAGNDGELNVIHTVANDQITEGKEYLAIYTYSDADHVNQTGYSIGQHIVDTSKTPTPTYTISPSATSINEGETLTTSISTTNVAANTTLYYSLSGTGITSSDFSSGALTGAGTVDSNGAFSFSHTLASNGITEGIEILEIKLFSDSSRTTQIGTTSFVDIKDTSNDESSTRGAGSTWQYVNSRTTIGSVGNQVGKITLNNDGTISVSGSYTSDLNSDQTAAINGGGFQKYSQVDMECTQHKEVMDHY